VIEVHENESAVRRRLTDREYTVDERGSVWICRG